MADQQSAFELAESGRFRDAARTIDSSKTLTTELRVLRARIELEIGSRERARASAEELLRERLTARDKASCWQILSRIDLKSGRVDDGVKAFHRALKAAEDSQDPRFVSRLIALHCEALLHWVSVEAGAVELPRVRRAAVVSGDFFSLVVLHWLAAEMQAQKSFVASATRNIKAGRSLLQRWPNVELEGHLANTESAICLFESDYDAALVAIKAALRCAEESGSRRIRSAALGNLSHIRLLTGDLDEAEKAVNDFVAQVQGGYAEIVGRDTEFQIALARRDFALTKKLAAHLREISEKIEGGQSYYGLWHRVNRTKWCYRTGRAEEGLTLAIESLVPIERTADRHLITQVRLLIAEGMARTGRSTDGAAVLAEAMGAFEQHSLDMLGESMRVSGILTAGSDDSVSKQNFDRSARLFDAIGNVTARNDVIEDAAAVLNLRVPLDPSEDARCAPLQDPVSEASRESLIQSVIEKVAGISKLSALPPLVAQEFLALIVESNAALDASIVVRRADEGADDDAVPGRTGTNAAVRIQFGTHCGKGFEIVATPRPTPSARIVLLSLGHLAQTTRGAHHSERVESEANLWPQQTPEHQLGLICASERIQELINTIRRVADSNVTVLLTGETGVGKELFARALHQASPRSNKTFLPFNCTTVPRDMFDSQLFGHKRGSFTGAVEDAQGVIRAAAGGTLFLDEIGEMSLDVQPKLLRFLESGEVQPLGDPTPKRVDVRIVAATNAKLDHAVSEGRFREDLYYRLNVIRIDIPPLRERREEIPALVEHFLERFGREQQKPLLRIADDTLEYLVLYRWPGNVRQLANEIRRMVAMAEPGSVLMPAHLSNDIAASRKTVSASAPPPRQANEILTRIDQPLSAAVEHVERAAIQRAMMLADGRLEDAAKLLGLSRKGLYLKRQRLGLE